jgi:hypothetical protein
MSKVYVGLGGYRAQLAPDQVVKFYSAGGGFQKSIPLERFLSEFKEELEPPAMRAALFCLDDCPDFPGFHKGDRWNGWGMPSFTHEVALQIAEATNMVGYTLEYNAAEDQWEYHSVDTLADGEGPDVYGAHTIIVDGVEHKVYDIGSGFWCWNVTELEDKTNG